MVFPRGDREVCLTVGYILLSLRTGKKGVHDKSAKSIVLARRHYACPVGRPCHPIQPLSWVFDAVVEVPLRALEVV